MKLKIYIKGELPIILKIGDCVDLKLAEPVKMKKGEFAIFSLGVAMKLPKGLRANVYSRSSLPKNGVIVANSVGIIDNSYNGTNDVWRIPLYAINDCDLPKGTRVCQFEIVPSQFATIWQRIKWLFTSKIEFVSTDRLESTDRKGIGTTGL